MDRKYKYMDLPKHTHIHTHTHTHTRFTLHVPPYFMQLSLSTHTHTHTHTHTLTSTGHVMKHSLMEICLSHLLNISTAGLAALPAVMGPLPLSHDISVCPMPQAQAVLWGVVAVVRGGVCGAR